MLGQSDTTTQEKDPIVKSWDEDPRWREADFDTRSSAVGYYFDKYVAPEKHSGIGKDKLSQIRSSYMSANAPQRPGFLGSFERGIQETQGMLYGATALAGSATGIDPIKNWGMRGYRRNMAEAEENAATVRLGEIDSLADAGVWATETLGSIIPTMIEAAVGAGIGTMVAPGVGSITGIAGRGLVKKSIEKSITKAMANKAGQRFLAQKVMEGASTAQAKKALRDKITAATIRNIGGKVGMGLAVLPMESGSNFGELYDEHGKETPWSSLAFGAMGTALEYVGGNARLINRFIPGGGDAVKAAVKTGDASIIKDVAKSILKQAPEEAFQEAGQEVFSILNLVANTDEKLFTKENWERVKESAAAGALAGGVGGGFGGTVSGVSKKAKKPKGGKGDGYDLALEILDETYKEKFAGEDADIEGAVPIEEAPEDMGTGGPAEDSVPLDEEDLADAEEVREDQGQTDQKGKKREGSKDTGSEDFQQAKEEGGEASDRETQESKEEEVKPAKYRGAVFNFDTAEEGAAFEEHFKGSKLMPDVGESNKKFKERLGREWEKYKADQGLTFGKAKPEEKAAEGKKEEPEEEFESIVHEGLTFQPKTAEEKAEIEEFLEVKNPARNIEDETEEDYSARVAMEFDLYKKSKGKGSGTGTGTGGIPTGGTTVDIRPVSEGKEGEKAPEETPAEGGFRTTTIEKTISHARFLPKDNILLKTKTDEITNNIWILKKEFLPKPLLERVQTGGKIADSTGSWEEARKDATSATIVGMYEFDAEFTDGTKGKSKVIILKNEKGDISAVNAEELDYLKKHIKNASFKFGNYGKGVLILSGEKEAGLMLPFGFSADELKLLKEKIGKAEGEATTPVKVGKPTTTEYTPTEKRKPVEYGFLTFRAETVNKYVPTLTKRIEHSQKALWDSEAFASSPFYDGSYPIPKKGGITRARKSQKYKKDAAYRAKVDDAISQVVRDIVESNRILLALQGEASTGSMGVSYAVEKVRAKYGVDVGRAWHNEAKSKYPYTSYLGDVAVREAVQNSLDAVLESIENGEIKRGLIQVSVPDGRKGYQIRDNGIGMSDVDIAERFLVLHATGKDKQGRFGGFGIAGAVILWPSDAATWELDTRDNHFTHEMALENEQVQQAKKIQGTNIKVKTERMVVSHLAQMYVETTETPKNVIIKYNDKVLKNPFKGRKGTAYRGSVESGGVTSFIDATYYSRPRKDTNYNKQIILRLVDEQTGAKLTQGIVPIWSENFNGTIVVDVTTPATPGSNAYPLTDSRMELKYDGKKILEKIIEKYTVDKKSADRVEVTSNNYYASQRAEWADTIKKIDYGEGKSDEGYDDLMATIGEIWEELLPSADVDTSKVFPVTDLQSLPLKIDVGYKGYKGGSIFNAKHLAAFEAIARIYAQASGANLLNFYGLLSKPVGGGVIGAEYSSDLGSLGFNFVNVDKSALKDPLEYAMYLVGLVNHEFTHAEFSGHDEDFSSYREAVQKKTAKFLPYAIRIAEKVLGKESKLVERGKVKPKVITKEKVVTKEVILETPVEVLREILPPKQLSWIEENIEKEFADGKVELYRPEPKGAARQPGLFGQAVDRGSTKRAGPAGGTKHRGSDELSDTQGTAEAGKERVDAGTTGKGTGKQAGEITPKIYTDYATKEDAAKAVKYLAYLIDQSRNDPRQKTFLEKHKQAIIQESNIKHDPAFKKAVDANKDVIAQKEDGKWLEDRTDIPVRVEFENVTFYGSVSEGFALRGWFATTTTREAVTEGLRKKKAYAGPSRQQKTKWGEFLGVAPLGVEDPVPQFNSVYEYKEHSKPRKDFVQRANLKKLLGSKWAPLVTFAFRGRQKAKTAAEFNDKLFTLQHHKEEAITFKYASGHTQTQGKDGGKYYGVDLVKVIKEKTGLTPEEFWKVANGKMELPEGKPAAEKKPTAKKASPVKETTVENTLFTAPGKDKALTEQQIESLVDSLGIFADEDEVGELYKSYQKGDLKAALEQFLGHKLEKKDELVLRDFVKGLSSKKGKKKTPPPTKIIEQEGKKAQLKTFAEEAIESYGIKEAVKLGLISPEEAVIIDGIMATFPETYRKHFDVRFSKQEFAPTKEQAKIAGVGKPEGKKLAGVLLEEKIGELKTDAKHVAVLFRDSNITDFIHEFGEFAYSRLLTGRERSIVKRLYLQDTLKSASMFRNEWFSKRFEKWWLQQKPVDKSLQNILLKVLRAIKDIYTRFVALTKYGYIAQPHIDHELATIFSNIITEARDINEKYYESDREIIDKYVIGQAPDQQVIDRQGFSGNEKTYLSWDPSSICHKNKAFIDFMVQQIKKEGRPITDLANIDVLSRYYEEAKKQGVQVPCSYCYVNQARRKAVAYHSQGRPSTVVGLAMARLMYSSVPYVDYIQKLSPKKIEEINKRGGLRMFSFSDYVRALHKDETTKLLKDAKRRGLSVKAITKNPHFVEDFADTGIVINLSIDTVENSTGVPWDVAANLKNKYSNVKIRSVALNFEEFKMFTELKHNGITDFVDVITPYHHDDTTKPIPEGYENMGHKSRGGKKVAAYVANHPGLDKRVCCLVDGKCFSSKHQKQCASNCGNIAGNLSVPDVTIAGDIQFSQTQTTTGSTKAPILQSYFNRRAKDWDVNLKVVQKQSELPAEMLRKIPEGSKAEAAVQKSTNTIYIVADNVSLQRGKVVAVKHELVHLGIEQVLGKQYKAIMNGIKKDFGLADNAHPEEFMARLSDRGIGAKWYDKIISLIRDWMRKFDPSLAYSQHELRELYTSLADMAVKTAKGPGAAAEGVGVGEFAQDVMLSLKEAAKKITDNPAFTKWFGGSKVVGENGDPLVVYRGEHGEVPADQAFTSRSASLSFGDAATAGFYAVDPNKRDDVPIAPRIFPVYLSIKKPLVNDKTDPFIDMSVVSETLGRDQAVKIAKQYSEFIDETDNWRDKFSEDYTTVEDLLNQYPEKVDELYLNIFPLLDDAAIVKALKAKGFDGAIHAGYGENSGEAEYKVFSPNQVKSIYNRGTFDPTNPDIMFSKTPDEKSDKVTNLATKPVREFAKKMRGDIATKVAEIKKRVAEYDGWKFEIGDRVTGSVEGRVYTIIGKSFNKNDPIYYYRGNDGSEGTFSVSRGAHESLTKMTGPTSPDVMFSLTTDPEAEKVDDKGFVKKLTRWAKNLGKPLDTVYERVKDEWLGNRDWSSLQASVEAGTFQERIQNSAKETKQNWKDVDKAIHIYLDLQKFPEHFQQYYKDLTEEQQILVDLSRNLTAEQKEIAKDIDVIYQVIGNLARKNKVLRNLIDGYVARVWDFGEKKPSYDFYRKFGTTSRHSRKRTLGSIVEGWAKGGKLKIEGATNNLSTYKVEILNTIENKRLVKEGRATTLSNGQILFTFKHLKGYEMIQHPGMVDWGSPVASIRTDFVKDVNERLWRESKKQRSETKKIKLEGAEGPIETEEAGTIQTLKQVVRDSLMGRGMTEGEADTYIHRLQNAKKIADVSGVTKEIIEKYVVETETIKEVREKYENVISIKFEPQLGQDFIITEKGDIFRKRRIFAPEQIADNMNNILGSSNIKGVPGVLGLTKLNAIAKAIILQTSLFHHQAFVRSYWFGGAVGPKDLNFVKAYKQGLELIKAEDPLIKLLVKNGLTLGRIQDWDENLLRQKTQVGEWLDQWKAPKAVKDKIVGWQEQQAHFLFNKFGAGLKAMAAILEYRQLTDKHREMSESQRAKRAADLVNDDFGGLHLQRMGRNPTLQHIARLFLLAPDWCLLSDTRAMTKTGWKYHHELKVGTDEILAFNPDTKKYQWSKLNDMYVREGFSDEMVKIKNHNRAIMATKDHKCYVYNSSKKKNEIVLAKDLNTSHRIPRSAGFDLPQENSYDDIHVELSGWFVTDGFTKKSKWKLKDGSVKEYRYGKITQAKPATVKILQKFGMKEHVDYTNCDHDKFKANYYKHVFTIPKKNFVQMQKDGLCNGLNWDFLSKLTKKQLQLLYKTMMLADGTGQGRFCGEERKIFYMTMIQTLLGEASTFYQQEPKCWRTRKLSDSKKYITCASNNLTTEKIVDGTIWCPSVDTGFWLAEREGLMFITGNTESNVRSMYKMLVTGGPESKALYRRFWGRIAVRAFTLTTVMNLLLAALDEEEDEVGKKLSYADRVKRRYEKAWKKGYMRWLEADISPVYWATGGEEEKRSYFRLAGHFLDIAKFTSAPFTSLHHKGSPTYRIAHEALTGSDWRGRNFTTWDELIGLGMEAGKRGQLTKYSTGERGPIQWDQIPSYTLAQMRQVQPILVQNALSWLSGEADGFAAASKSAGIMISVSKDTNVQKMRYDENRKKIDRTIRATRDLKPGEKKGVILRGWDSIYEYNLAKDLYKRYRKRVLAIKQQIEEITELGLADEVRRRRTANLEQQLNRLYRIFNRRYENILKAA